LLPGIGVFHTTNHGSGRRKVEQDCNAAWQDIVRCEVCGGLEITCTYFAGAKRQPAMMTFTTAGGAVRGQLARTAEKSAAEKILDLKGLLDAGAITQDEFDTKKSELLVQM
jgi:hypothetical protein